MKYTLKEMVDRILESMDSDEVNTYSDTAESLAVANIIKECYYDIVGDSVLKEHTGLFQLTASGDNTKPALMYLPSTILDVYKISYNTEDTSDPQYQDVEYLDFDEFIRRTNTLNPDNTEVETQTVTVNGSDFVFKFYNDRDPQFYTSPDDYTLLFDAYDSDVDTTLQSSKTMCTGLIAPTFTMDDNYVPDLDARQFQLLLQASKAQAFVELKQTQNPKAEQKERRNKIITQGQKDNLDHRSALQKHPQYGRK